jgi:pre-mRNA-splicing factor SYF2/beta-D-xylosidase 4|tara:strand:- start:447 stop:1286 length:840 start_codon:yes stop_codon:yes gene_type:complete
MDTDCGRFMGAKAMTTLLQNATIATMADTSLTRLFAVQMRLGFFDPRSSFAPAMFGEEVINTAAHQALAKEAADQSLVLLKNDAKTLPLAKTFEHSGKMVAVVGRNAEATTNMQGNYFGTAPFLISPCAGINATLKGFTWCDKADDKGAATIALINAGKIGAVVLVVGLTSEGAAGSHDEAEGHDRSSLLLPNDQDAAISAIATAAAAKKVQVVVVSMGGGPVDLSACKANSAIGAIMWCGYPGQSGGAAIADALFGATNPSGKLTMTVSRDEERDLRD